MMQQSSLDPLQAASEALAGIAERVGAAVLAVEAGRRHTASGFLFAPGVVVTAAHVVRCRERVRLLSAQGDPLESTLAGVDAGTDVAVLRAPDSDLAPAAEGEADALRPGNIVLALARHGSGRIRLDYGLIGAAGPAWRTWRGAEIDRFLALDGALRPGFAGGPVADASGRVIGMATPALLRGAGAIVPRSTLRRVVAALLERGYVARGYLGLGLQPSELPAETVAALGRDSRHALLVAAVEAGGPGARAGLMVGDVLIGLAGRASTTLEDVLAVLGTAGAGEAVAAELLRGGQRIEAAIALGERPQRRCG
jgi:S1-C subfamily serine protease